MTIDKNVIVKEWKEVEVMAFKEAETLAGLFTQKIKPESRKTNHSGPKKEARPTQYPTTPNQWDSDEFGLV